MPELPQHRTPAAALTGLDRGIRSTPATVTSRRVSQDPTYRFRVVLKVRQPLKWHGLRLAKAGNPEGQEPRV